MTDFISLGVSQLLITTLKKLQITTPTPIQTATIPLVLEGHDILASAQTGTGKTFAYCIPLLLKLIENKEASALIIAPTRELAIQVSNAMKQLVNQEPSLKTALLIGGDSMSKQMAQLRSRPRIIIGTPGRITDHLMRGTVSLQKTKFFIIDEADRMLDMGFGVQLEKILTYLPKIRQTLMFSATFPPNIARLSENYLNEPKRITVGSCTQPIEAIKQSVLQVTSAQKLSTLIHELGTRDGSVIVFVKTRRSADRLARELSENGHEANPIHSDLSQRRREQVILSFRNNKTRILVATDIAARGLDIPHVKHVINYDLPQCPEDYIHRIGRTARAGAEGFALSLVSGEDWIKWRAIERLINKKDGSSASLSLSLPKGTQNKPKRTFQRPVRGPFKKPVSENRNPQTPPRGAVSHPNPSSKPFFVKNKSHPGARRNKAAPFFGDSRSTAQKSGQKVQKSRPLFDYKH